MDLSSIKTSCTFFVDLMKSMIISYIDFRIFLSDIHVLDFSTMTWSEIDTESQPIGREYPACVFHEPSNNIILYGGIIS